MICAICGGDDGEWIFHVYLEGKGSVYICAACVMARLQRTRATPKQDVLANWSPTKAESLEGVTREDVRTTIEETDRAMKGNRTAIERSVK